MTERTLIVGSRGSDLALEQTRRVREALPGPSELRIIRTSGDRKRDLPMSEQTGAGFFTKEIEDSLLAGRVDLAVHSLKDLPTALAPGLAFGAMLRRDVPTDLLLVRPEAHDGGRDPRSDLPVRDGASVGASSMRRQALLGSYRPDLVPSPIRGNVPTRVDKARRGDYDAIVLSRAGLERLRFDAAPLLLFELNPGRWPGAPGQATIAVEVRAGDGEVARRLEPLRHRPTETLVEAERGLLAAYGSGCHAPFGAYARPVAGGFDIDVAVPGTDDRFRIRRFSGPTLAEARAEAEAWVLSDRTAGPAAPDRSEEDWLCRPAPAWS